MQVIESLHEMQSMSIGQRSKGRLIGLVPTMGALHPGHESLIRIACEKADFTVVSIFVNPTQFGPNEDFDQYPAPLGERSSRLRAQWRRNCFLPKRSRNLPSGLFHFH